MPRAPRCYADPAKQAAVRDEIREFGPVKYIVRVLQTDGWDEAETKENAVKLQYAMAMVHKLAPNLRHQTVETQRDNRNSLAEYSDAELLEQITDRRGFDAGGTGGDSPH